MARRLDTGWRDGLLAVRHHYWGYEAPAAGTPFPMIEYDRGEAIAVISYQRRGDELPRGRESGTTHKAFSNLYNFGVQLPFFTVQYDVRNWSYRLFGHNLPAREFLDRMGWVPMTEQQFADSLYRLRGRHTPDLTSAGVVFERNDWLPEDPAEGLKVSEDWPHQLMSTRRRNFEPVGQTRMSWRNPCLDIDLAVPDPDGRLSLLVDYKAPGARVNLKSTNVEALGSLFVALPQGGLNVAAMVVRYQPTKPYWGIQVHCVNQSARQLLSYALGATSADPAAMSQAIAGNEWVDLTERQWLDVLGVASKL